MRFAAVSALVVLTAFPVFAAPATATKPNIVLLVADDLGRSDIGFNGSKEIRTPNLDRFAATGVRLDRFYACPVCSPTRAGLMTGRWPIRDGLMRTVVPPWSSYGLPPAEVTIAEMLAPAGYARRGIVGKWHLGHARPDLLPLAQGFTSFYGHYNGALDYFTHVREGEVDWHRDAETVKEPGYTTDLLAAEATRFVGSSPAGQPYFLYVPFNAPHAPHQALEEDLARYPNLRGERRKYAAMVDRLDRGIGTILRAIESRPDANNTFVLFASDNGGHIPPARNAPFRSGKASVYEGGIRVAAAVRWPAGGLSGGRVCSEPIGYIDVFPTLRHLAGLEPPVGGPLLDGIDVLDVLRGERKVPERPWFSYIAHGELGQAAVALADRKLVAEGQDVFAAERGPDLKLELYDLAADPTESHDLAAANPAEVESLRQRLVGFGRLRPAESVAPYAEGRKGFKAPRDWIIR
jgi:arylsulfatase A-like enzyme